MNKGMNLPERLKFCLETTIFKKTDEETLDILRKLQTDNTIVSIGKIPVHDFATAALIYLNVISYDENCTENTDYLLEVYTGLKKEYENGTLKLQGAASQKEVFIRQLDKGLPYYLHHSQTEPY